MATDRELLKSAQVGALVSAGLSDPELAVKQMHRKEYVFFLTDDGDAGTPNPEMAIPMPVACRVVSCKVTAPIAVTGHATTNAVFTVAKRTGAGSATTISTFTTTLSAPANSLAAFVPAAMTVTAADAVLAASDVLTCKLTKGSTGVAVTTAAGDDTAAGSRCTVTVVVEEIG